MAPNGGMISYARKGINRMKQTIFLTKEKEKELSENCQKALRRLRKRIGSAVKEGCTPEILMSAAKARRPVPKEIEVIEAIRNEFVESCSPWAIHVAQRTFFKAGNRLERDDLIQNAMFGLMRGALRFDHRKAKWSTYCTWWIYQALSRAIRNDASMIRVPECRQSQHRLGQLDEETAEQVRVAMSVGLEPVPATIPDRDHHPEPSDPIPEMRRILTKRELEIMLRRYGLGGHYPQTLHAVGDKLNLSRERVRQIQVFALRKLKESKILREEFEHEI